MNYFYTMTSAYLLLGSNMNDPEKQLSRAETLIAERIGPVRASSSIYQTAAWGNREQPDFLNRALTIETNLSPRQLIEEILLIEESMGRKRSKKNDPRIIDIDILLYGDIIVDEEDLKIPHPFLTERRFALEPLHEMAPRVIHPALGKEIAALLEACGDMLAVKKI